MSLSNPLFLLTGSNIEPRLSYLRQASNWVEGHVGEIVGKSSVYESEPWGFEDGEKFLNQVLVVQSDLPPLKVLERIISIERGMGRVRNSRGYESRIIDIDMLYYGDMILESPELVIPHPRLHLRRFTLLPLSEVAGDLEHPLLLKKNSELLDICADRSIVLRYEETGQ